MGESKSCYKNWMHSVSTINTWTVCIHFSTTNSVMKWLSRVDKSLILCRGQFISTTNTEEWTESPALQKRDARGKSTKNFPELLQKTKSTQTSESVFEDGFEQFEKTKFEIALIKNLE